MLIGFIFAIWIIWAAVFVFGVCLAAARPLPRPEPVTENFETFTLTSL